MKTPTPLEGYKAAANTVRSLLNDARERKPLRVPKNVEKLAAYRMGYYTALVIADSLRALGEFPSHNVEAIREAKP